MSDPQDKFLLDTSALLTLLEEEAGADRVEHVLRQSQALVSAVSLLEVRYISLQEKSQSEADLRHALIKRSGAEILWDLDEPAVLKAAAFKAQHHLSVAEALIAANAHRYGATLLHKDPEFDALGAQIKVERLPYKQARQRDKG